MLADRTEMLELNGVEPAIAQRNPRATPIFGMILSARRGEAHVQVQLDSTGRVDGCGIRLFATSPDQSSVASIGEVWMRDEAKNTRDVWNSWHRICP